MSARAEREGIEQAAQRVLRIMEDYAVHCEMSIANKRPALELRYQAGYQDGLARVYRFLTWFAKHGEFPEERASNA